MVAPLMHGMSNIVNPYVELKTEDQLDDPVYIGGVINPLFKSSKKFQEMYDVLICIDKPGDKTNNLHASHSHDQPKAPLSFVIPNNNKEKGQEYYDFKEMLYYELDCQFINSIAQRMREIGDVDDEDLAHAFQNYTQLMIDLAMISEDSQYHKYDPNLIELVRIYEYRLSLMKRTLTFQNQLCLKQLAEFDSKNGGIKGEISFHDGLVVPIRKLTLSSEMGNMEIYEHLEKIDSYLQDEDSVIKLLYCMPQHRQGLSIIAEGLFSSNQEIMKISTKILLKIQRCEVGALAVQQNLTMFHMLKLSELSLQFDPLHE